MFSSFVNLAIDQKVTALDNLIDMKKLLKLNPQYPISIGIVLMGVRVKLTPEPQMAVFWLYLCCILHHSNYHNEYLYFNKV